MKELEFESREKWLVLGMLWLVCFLNYADRQAISSIFPLLEKDFGFSKSELGLIGSAFMVIYALASPVAGYAGDCVSRKGLLVGGCLLWSLMTGVTGFCGLLWQFVTTRSLMALGESVYFPSATSLLSDYHGQKTRSTALSFHQSAVYLGTIAGGSLAALLAAHFGWRWAFYGFGLFGMVVVLMLGKWLREPIRGRAEVSKVAEEPVLTIGFKELFCALLEQPGVLFLMLAFAFANGVASIFLIWAPTFLFQKFHLSLVAAGFSAVAAIQLASALSAPLSGILADGLSVSIKGARMLVQLGGLVLGSICVAGVGHASTMALLVVAMICFGLCKGVYDGGIFASVFDLVSPRERSSAAGLMNMIGWGGGSLGPLAIGFYSTYGHGTQMERMSGAIAWSGAAYLVAAGLILAAFRSQRKVS